MIKTKFARLDVDLLRHPEDSEVIDSLNKIPFFKKFLNNTIVPIKEAYNEVESFGDGWSITHQSAPKIYKTLKEACETLGIRTIPKLASEWFYAPSSFSAGNENFRIVISSGSIDLFEEEELIFFLGHELGHYICGHKPYQMLLEALYLPVIDEPTVKMWSTIVKVPLLDWYRKSDFTADRVGLLCCQNIDVALRVMIKRAGLPKKCYNQINTRAFLKQAYDFENNHSGTLDKIAKSLSLRSCEYPWMVQRAERLYEWYNSGKYQRFINNNRKSV